MTRELFLSLGSNLGDRTANIKKAYSEIEKNVGNILAESSFFENEAEGFEADTKFINSCIQVQTKLTAKEVLKNIKEIEKSLGRIKDSSFAGYQSRLIDIDIIFYRDEIVNTPKLQIPHPNFRTRKFVLFPLNEIAKNQIDPITQLSIEQLLNALNKK
jgi:deoxyguanosine kinase